MCHLQQKYSIFTFIYLETFLSREKIEGGWCCALRAQVLREAPIKLDLCPLCEGEVPLTTAKITEINGPVPS